MNLQELKAEFEKRSKEIMTNNRVFFAFSNRQFDENKTELMEGEKYVILMNGMYCPKSCALNFKTEFGNLIGWYKEMIRINNLRQAVIRFELSNRESLYTGDIEDTLDALGEDYTEAEVWEIYDLMRQEEREFEGA
jgi:hypothetical protein